MPIILYLQPWNPTPPCKLQLLYDVSKFSGNFVNLTWISKSFLDAWLKSIDPKQVYYTTALYLHILRDVNSSHNVLKWILCNFF